jgi:hypothetical protein
LRVPEIPEFFEILRSDDPEAAGQLLNWLDPWLRGVIRSRIAARRLSGAMDVSDVLQSLFKDFVQRANRAGAEPKPKGEIERFLAGAVAKKILARLRKERRHPGGLSEEPKALGPPADRIAEGSDFIASIRRHLNEKNQRLMDLRLQGYTWPELSSIDGRKPDALRMRLRRSVAAAICELGEEGQFRHE